MKSRWHRGQGDDQHVPVEMRFIDMFMTAIGSLVFIAMLLVFLLPKTTQIKPEEVHVCKRELQECENKRTEDMQILLRAFGVMLVTDGRCAEQPELYVRWEGDLVNFKDGKSIGKAAEFDASEPTNKTELAGHIYFNVGGVLEPHINRRINTQIYFGTSRSPGSFSVYAGLKAPGAGKGKDCTIYPLYLSAEGVTTGDEIVLTQKRPYAWLRRFTVNVDGTTSLKTEPKDDDDFKRRLEEFSKKQSKSLCQGNKRICGTTDAHYAKLFPVPDTDKNMQDTTKFIGTAIVETTQVNVRSAPDFADPRNIKGKLNRGRVVNIVRHMDNGWDEIEATCDDTNKNCHGFVKSINLGNFSIPTPGPTR